MHRRNSPLAIRQRISEIKHPLYTISVLPSEFEQIAQSMNIDAKEAREVFEAMTANEFLHGFGDEVAH